MGPVIGVDRCSDAPEQQLSSRGDADPCSLAQHQAVALERGELRFLVTEVTEGPREASAERVDVHLQAAEEPHDQGAPGQVLAAGTVAAHRGEPALLEHPRPVVYLARILDVRPAHLGDGGWTEGEHVAVGAGGVAHEVPAEGPGAAGPAELVAPPGRG